MNVAKEGEQFTRMRPKRGEWVWVLGPPGGGGEAAADLHDGDVYPGNLFGDG